MKKPIVIIMYEIIMNEIIMMASHVLQADRK